MANHLTSDILEAKNIAVPNVVPYRNKLKLTEEVRLASETNVGNVGVEIGTVNSKNS
jgi:hypothetical protein